MGSTENEFGSGEWRASCSCGWTSPLLFSDRAATAALSAHFAAVANGGA